MDYSVSKAVCSFHASDNEDETFWICVNPQSGPPRLGGRPVKAGLDIKLGTPMNEADGLAATMRKYMAHGRVWQD